VNKLSHWQGAFTEKAAPLHLLGPRGGALIAASAVAAFAWRELEHRRVTSADLTETGLKVETLWDIRDDAARLAQIEGALREEWGEYALLGFSSAERMATLAGRWILVASDAESHRPLGALQTTLVEAAGDPARLREQYPTFEDLTQPKVWARARRHGGDTAVLLQITIFGRNERGAGLGSLLRNAALHMQDRHVRFALTMTPIDGDARRLDLQDESTFTPAMRFHARGGAQATAILPAFKRWVTDGEDRHGEDVAVMRYVRDGSGSWPAPKPEMRLHSVGPLQEGVSGTARRLAKFPSRGRRALGGLRRVAAKRRLALPGWKRSPGRVDSRV
jgi:hypothetical protein